MKEGFIESLINKILLYGAAGTGKSSFMDLMIGNPPRKIRISTPLAARPVSVFQMSMDQKKWAKLSRKERKEILIQALMSIELVNVVEVEDGEEEEEASSRSDDDAITGDLKPQSDIGGSVINQKNTSPMHEDHRLSKASSIGNEASQPLASKQSLSASISAYDDFVYLIELCSRTGKSIASLQKIIFIDSGGQPSFHEMLPAFLRRMNLYMFVFKLSEELDTKPEVKYYNSLGLAVGIPYQSPYTNKQLLQHCLRTLNTHRISAKLEDKPSKIMMIGTHRDEETKCTTETREDKNRKLAALLLPAFKDEVAYFSLAKEEFIFPVNAKDPQTQDKDLAEIIQRLVLTECSPKPVKIPLRYYCLEIILEEASETLGRGVLSIEECLEAAADLHFDKHTLDVALQFLDEISVVFYFPEVIEGVVFVDPQILLDKATELVEKIHYLRKGIEAAAFGEWHTFKKHALFSIDFLHHECFQKHYEPGLFTPIDLVKLFKRLHVIAKFSDTKYFMPALLEVLEEDKLHNYRVPDDSLVAGLAMDFPLGGPRHGTFCALICFLISPGNHFPKPWEIELLPDSSTPVCLYRNCIQFAIPGFPGAVTLIDTFTHFEVHVVNTAKKVAGKLCSFVHEAVFTGLRKAMLSLGYSRCIPLLALVCPCGTGLSHMASMENELWTCTRDRRKWGDLNDSQLQWKDFKDKGESFTTSYFHGNPYTTLSCNLLVLTLCKSFPLPAWSFLIRKHRSSAVSC
jgi:GTPase SAR1 family protein